MANTFTQLFVHAVFAVKYRDSAIPLDKRSEIYAYMSGIINRHPKCQLISIGGVHDHVHMLFRYPPSAQLSEIIQSVKIGTTNYINKQRFTRGRFSWQDGYGAFSVSATHTDDVVKYIESQEEHHLRHHVPFLEEFKRILARNNITSNYEFIFKELE